MGRGNIDGKVERRRRQAVQEEVPHTIAWEEFMCPKGHTHRGFIRRSIETGKSIHPIVCPSRGCGVEFFPPKLQS